MSKKKKEVKKEIRIVTEEKFERMKKFAEKERNFTPQPEEVFTEWN